MLRACHILSGQVSRFLDMKLGLKASPAVSLLELLMMTMACMPFCTCSLPRLVKSSTGHRLRWWTCQARPCFQPDTFFGGWRLNNNRQCTMIKWVSAPRQDFPKLVRQLVRCVWVSCDLYNTLCSLTPKKATWHIFHCFPSPVSQLLFSDIAGGYVQCLAAVLCLSLQPICSMRPSKQWTIVWGPSAGQLQGGDFPEWREH